LTRISQHKAVYVTYVIQDEAGGILDQNDVAVGYIHGVGGPLFKPIEAALEGCEPGDTVTVTLPPDEAFGAHDDSLTFTDSLENVPPELRYVGAEAEMQNERGEVRQFRVTRIGDGTLTVDANHPFAGRTLTFRVTAQEVRDATADEISRGLPADMAAPTIN